MKNTLLTFITLPSMLMAAPEHQDGAAAARAVIDAFTQGATPPMELRLEPSDGNKQYKLRYQDGALSITANSGVALCRAFYDFAKANQLGVSSWSGNRFDAQQLPQQEQNMAKTSLFKHHYYFNVVTYGYTMPYWDWARWSQEIDWMALHGIDMPLALVAQEAIMARVFKKLGLSDEEIASYFVGPAHLPWMRMGNLSGIDGPLSSQWHEGQIKMQHQILSKMRALGMKPICPAFAGFVPPALQRLFPEVKLTKTSWAGSFHNWMLSPEDELFVSIGREFIKEWEAEFGANDYYLADSFNEMEIPFPPKGTEERTHLLQSYGKQVYRAISEANPKAIWVMQGWMFGYQREIWDSDTLAALLTHVPDDKMLLLDLAADYNAHFWHNGFNWDAHRGFYGKQWIYSVIPNMGGKTGHTGVLDFYANGHWEALNSPNRGNLVGFGMAPEGIENNEVIYELLCDAGWSDERIALPDWLKNYSACRYGSAAGDFTEFWTKMQASVYAGFTDHPRFNWQFRPGLSRRGSIQFNEQYLQALRSFVAAAAQSPDSPLLQADVAEMSAMYLGCQLELLSVQIEECYAAGQDATAHIATFQELMLAMDKLLAAHPTLSLAHWEHFAAAYDKRESSAKKYQSNARRLISIWGPPINDYSARVWSGLIRDYYLPRWMQYFANRQGANKDIAQWEQAWVEQCPELSEVQAFPNILAAAKYWMNAADGALAGGQASKENLIAQLQLKPKSEPIALSLSFAQLKQTNAIRLNAGGAALLQSACLLLDGASIPMQVDIKNNQLRWQVPATATGNNECKLILTPSPKAQGALSLEWIF